MKSFISGACGALAVILSLAGLQLHWESIEQARQEGLTATIVRNAQPIAAMQTAKPVSFDNLTPCDQLDSIAKSGQSVSSFLIAAAGVNDLAKYEQAIAAACPWNAEQLKVADRIVNPPVKPSISIQGIMESAELIAAESPYYVPPAPAPAQPQPIQPYNNCNGIQEPGEVYSSRCEEIQRYNDETIQRQIYRPLKPGDNRSDALKPQWREGATQATQADHPRGFDY